MKTKAIEVISSVVCTPMDDAMGSKSTIRTKKEAIKVILEEVKQRLEANIPDGMGCTTIVAHRVS